MARLTLTAGENVGLFMGNYTVFGTVPGHETVSVTAGTVVLDSSFNAGGDRLELAGLSFNYSVARSGATVTFTNSTGTTSVQVAAGNVGMTVHFNDTDRTLAIVNQTHVMLGDQEITSTKQTVASSGVAVTVGLDADTTLLAGDPLLAGVDRLTLGTQRDENATDGHQYSLTLSNATSPSHGPALVIDGTGLAADTDGLQGGPLTGETVMVDASAVTTYQVDVLLGAADDTVLAAASGGGIISTGAGFDTITMGLGVDFIDAGAGDDLIIAADLLTKADHVLGGPGTDTLVLSGHDYVDADLAGVSSVEAVKLATAGMKLSLDVNGGNAGMAVFYNATTGPDAGGVTVDATFYGAAASFVGGPGSDHFTGGIGADTFRGDAGADIMAGKSGADTYLYFAVAESFGATRDTVTDFVSNADKISITSIVGLAQPIAFRGNFGSNAAAVGDLHAGDGRINVVFDTAAHIVWFDMDDNALLIDSDLSIYLPATASLVGADVGSNVIFA